MRKQFCLFMFLCAPPLAAQIPNQPINPCIQQQACFFATVSGTVGASSSNTLTIQQPAAGGKQVNFLSGIVTCDTQTFTVGQAQNGTGATTTAGTAVALIPVLTTQGGATVAATAKVFTASNVGGGTATGPVIPFPSGVPAIIDLSMRSMAGSGINNNYSITVTNSGSGSCTATVSIYWMEKQ